MPTPPVVPTTTTGASWTLINNHRTACYAFASGSPSTTDYFVVWIRGNWSHAITVGIAGLPNSGTWCTSYSPVAPGSSDGIGSLAYVAAQLPSTTLVGQYTASLSATDGSVTQSVTVCLNV